VRRCCGTEHGMLSSDHSPMVGRNNGFQLRLGGLRVKLQFSALRRQLSAGYLRGTGDFLMMMRSSCHCFLSPGLFRTAVC